MKRTLEFFFDFRSPYSYLAYSQLPDLDVELVLRPMMVTGALFRACWGEARPLTSVAEILGVIAAAGVDPDPIAATIDDPATVAGLEANNREAAARGVFGSPTIFLGDTMFFGNDRLDFVREHLARQEVK